MGFFTPRERRELNRPAEITEFTPARRLRSHDLTDPGTMQRLTEAPLQEIDDLIAELMMRRERMLSESARVRRELTEYAKLSQSTMASTKIVTEALANWRKVPVAFNEPSIVPDDDLDGGAAAPHGSDQDAEPANSPDERSDVQ